MKVYSYLVIEVTTYQNLAEVLNETGKKGWLLIQKISYKEHPIAGASIRTELIFAKEELS